MGINEDKGMLGAKFGVTAWQARKNQHNLIPTSDKKKKRAKHAMAPNSPLLQSEEKQCSH
jgi:hypothetical protein